MGEENVKERAEKDGWKEREGGEKPVKKIDAEGKKERNRGSTHEEEEDKGEKRVRK